MPKPPWLKPGQPSPDDPPGADALDDAEEKRLASLTLRPDLPTHKGAQVVLIEEGWRPFTVIILRALKQSAKPGGRFNRTAVNAFAKALAEAGKLADAVAALLRRLGVGSEEELERIVTAYRQAERAEPEDTVEISVQRLEAHFRTSKGQSERAAIGSRLGFTVKGGKDA